MAIIGGFLSEEILITRWAGRGTVGCHFRGWESPPLVFLYVQWLLDVVYVVVLVVVLVVLAVDVDIFYTLSSVCKFRDQPRLEILWSHRNILFDNGQKISISPIKLNCSIVSLLKFIVNRCIIFKNLLNTCIYLAD
jgi:hypothetical protein